MKIVIVEDHEDFRDLLTRALNRRGFDAVSFATVGSAQQFLATQTTDAVITDVTLEEPEDGLEFARWFHALHPATPIVVLSGSDEVGPKARDAGAVEVLTKPVSASVLVEVLQRYV